MPRVLPRKKQKLRKQELEFCLIIVYENRVSEMALGRFYK